VQNSSRSVSFKMESNIKVYVLRLRPNQDLHKELDKFVKDNDLKAAFIITCVGSLTKGIT
jgi:predicted DNA-binding protein with PD1-like motif